MELWPSSSASVGDRTLSARRRKQKGKEREAGWDVPIVHTGAISAGTLSRQEDGQYSWIFAQGNEVGPRLATRQARQILPSSLVPNRPASGTNSKLNAERGAHFLRAHFPDIDVPAELLRDELTEVLANQRNLQEYDAFEGSLLQPVRCWEGPRKLSAFIAHPVGDLSNSLCITRLAPDAPHETQQVPSSQSCWTSSTPIRQIAVSGPTVDINLIETFLAVRTMGSIQALETKCMNAARMSAPPQTTPLWAIPFAELDSKTSVDVAIRRGERSSCLILNSEGSLFERVIDGASPLVKLWTPSSEYALDDPFWRLSVPTSEVGCFITSSRDIVHLDHRNPSSPSLLYRNENPTLLVNSADLEPEERLLCVSTTDTVLWLDRRFASRPVLGYKHYRGNDRTLRARWASVGEDQVTYLTSKHNGLVMVYDVSRPSNGPLGFRTPTYSLSPAFEANADITAFRHPSESTNRRLSFYELSRHGGIRCIETEMLESFGGGDFPEPSTTWTNEAPTTSDDTTASRDIPLLSRQAYSEINMRPVYETLFSTTDSLVEGEPEPVYDVLESMGDFWQSLDVPPEQILTTFDIAFRSGNEPSQLSRADFLTSSPLNSLRGFRALLQSRIPRNQIARHAPWHHSLGPFLERTIDEYTPDPQAMLDRITALGLAEDNLPVPVSQVSSAASQQVVLDLALAADIYSLTPFAGHSPSRLADVLSDDEALETMSLATGAMSLDDAEPPRVRYTYLRPVQHKPIQHYIDHDREHLAEPPTKEEPEAMGVRALLQEWTIGDSPEDYRYQELQGNVTRAPRWAHSVLMRQTPATQTAQSSAPRPPTIAVSRVPPAIIASSQPVPPSSQVPMTQAPPRPAESRRSNPDPILSQPAIGPNTQVLPGPFGGRQPMAKKKPAKKRVGGF